MDGVIALDCAGAVTAFEDAYVERARRELNGRLERAEAAVLDRRPPADGRRALAGWWCEPGGSGELIVLPNPWDERSAIADHHDYCWELSELVLDRLADALNEHHGVAHARMYWDLLLRSWLMYLLPAALDRRLYCLALSRLAPELPVAAGSAPPVPATMLDAVEAIRTDEGNRAFVTPIARSLGLGLTTIRQQDPPGPTPGPGRPRRALGARLLAAAAHTADRAVAVAIARGARASRRGAHSRDDGAAGVVIAGAFRLPRRDMLRLARGVPGLRFVPGAAHTAVTQAGRQLLGVRERLGELADADQRAAALAAAAAALLPRTVLEDYVALVERSSAAFGPASAVVAANYGAHDAENEFLGRCAEAGRPLAFAQHGGFYLQARVNGQERLERRPGSPFLSWGAEGDRVKPLPSPYLQRLRDSHRGGERVVMIEWIVPPDPYILRFATTPLGNQGHRQSALLADFARSAGAIRDRLFLKRFPAFVEGDVRDPVLSALPHEAPLGRGGATRLMARARLVVVSYPDTPFIEALTIGVPTVGLWDEELWEPRDEARAPFDLLREAGLVFSDPRAAAAQVERVYDDAGGWWASREVQTARRRFLDSFAVAGDWLADWSRFLRDFGGAPGVD